MPVFNANPIIIGADNDLLRSKIDDRLCILDIPFAGAVGVGRCEHTQLPRCDNVFFALDDQQRRCRTRGKSCSHYVEMKK